MMNITTIYLLLAIAVAFVSGDPWPNGENVCNQTINERVNQYVDVPVTYKVDYKTSCGIFPCTKTREEIRIDTKLVSKIVSSQRSTCCPGYAETPNKKCAPICLKPCANGNCIKPGVCKCSVEPGSNTPGFVGSTCRRFVCLPNNRWGSKCDLECNCGHNSFCSASTGKCICMHGWRGDNCSEECNSSTDCEDTELPPIMDPEVNVISDNLGSAQRLESMQARNLEGTDITDGSDNENGRGWIMLRPGLDTILLIMISVILVVILIWHRNYIKKLKDELYGPYATSYSGPSGSGSSNYANTTTYSGSTVYKRPRIPTPDEENLLNKNLSFASTTRAILLGGETHKPTQQTHKIHTNACLVNRRIETQLNNSHLNADQNTYSPITMGEFIAGLSAGQVSKVTNNSNLGDDHYQVPKSVGLRPTEVIPLDNESLDLSDYANQTLYEEIRPNDDKYPEK